MARSAWIDLLDPNEEELREHVPHELRGDAWAELMRPADPSGRSPRPSIKSHGDYVLGLILAAVAVREEDVVYYQEVDFVLSRERIVTVRKTPSERPPFDRATSATCVMQPSTSSRRDCHFVVYVASVHRPADAVTEEIDGFEGHHTTAREDTPPAAGSARPLHIQDLALTRDAVRGRRRPGRHRGPDAVHARGLPPGGRAAVRDDLRQAPARRRRRGLRARPALSRQGLPAGARIDRPERSRQAADVDRVDPPRPDLHRRALRPELHSHARVPLALWVRMVLVPDPTTIGQVGLPPARL